MVSGTVEARILSWSSALCRRSFLSYSPVGKNSGCRRGYAIGLSAGRPWAFSEFIACKVIVTWGPALPPRWRMRIVCCSTASLFPAVLFFPPASCSLSLPGLPTTLCTVQYGTYIVQTAERVGRSARLARCMSVLASRTREKTRIESERWAGLKSGQAITCDRGL